MTETYFIKLPFYMLNAKDDNEAKTVTVSFDNDVITTVDITAKNRDNMNVVEFSVTKEPNDYNLYVEVNTDGSDMSTNVCLDDIWISEDNVNFYSVLLNCPDIKSKIIPSIPDVDFKFDPSFGACLWYDMNITIPLSLRGNGLYNQKDLSQYKAKIDDIETNNKDLPEFLDKLKSAAELFKLRGFN